LIRAECGIRNLNMYHPLPLPTSEIAAVRNNLLAWGGHNLRDFPWRVTRDPYAVLVAEVLLHRTRALQVVPVYLKFITRYPDVETLAAANLEDLDRLLRPLGLRWRVPLLKDMAEQLIEAFDGQIPPSPEPLQMLPGVGPYIASATTCFAFDKPEIILDTNTVRILGRLTDTPVTDSSRRSKKFRDMMWDLIDQNHPRLFNLSLLDLAARVCTPTMPKCSSCPLKHQCYYGRRFLLSKNPSSL
jgi:A/G-specific adenine glycosylase